MKYPGTAGEVVELIGSLAGRIAESARKTLYSAIIGRGGLEIRENGFFQLVTPSGTRVFYVGPYGPNRPDGQPQQSVVVRRDDGTLAFDILDGDPFGGSPPYAQYWAFYDRTGNIIFGDDRDSGVGLARPYLSTPLFASSYTRMPGATGIVGDNLICDTGFQFKQHPTNTVWLRWITSDVGTTGSISIYLHEPAVGGATLIATRSAAYAYVDEYFTFSLAGPHMSQYKIYVEGTRTAGTGAICATGFVAMKQSF